MSNLGTAFAIGGTLVNVYDYSQGNLSGARLGYRVTGTGAAIGAAYLFGGPYGAAVGGLFFLGEKAWDMSKPLRNDISREYSELEREYWELENALRNGWIPE